MILAHLSTLALFLQEQQVSFSVTGLWGNMGVLAKCVVIILFIMSIWSLAVMIDRALYFSAARKQSREFAPKVAGALKEGRLDEAIKLGDRSKKSHLAEVVTAGLQEFRSFGSGGSITDEHIRSLVAAGHPNKIIARRLGISEKTVKSHLTSVYRQIGVNDRVQAALWARDHGITSGS